MRTWKYLGHVFRVKAEHLPQRGKKNPFPHHPLARQKFSRSAAGSYPLLCAAGRAELGSLLPARGGAGQEQPPCPGTTPEALRGGAGYNTDVRFGPLYRKCARDGERPPRPAGALRGALRGGGKGWDWGVPQVYALTRKTRSGKRESWKVLRRRWVANHPPVLQRSCSRAGVKLCKPCPEGQHGTLSSLQPSHILCWGCNSE